MDRTPHTPVAEPGSAEFYQEVAVRMAARIAADAEWSGEACTWTIMAPDRDHPELRVAKPATASGTLYEGTSGIALFLAEVYAVAPSDQVARAAEGGVRFAVDEARTLPDSAFGFHGGRVGIAYAAALVGRRLGRPDLVALADEVLRPLVGNEGQDRGIDVIAGAGGAIPPLLHLAEWMEDRDLALSMARRLGDHLIDAAEREPGGWCWPTMRGSSIRNLCGYAHGAAGPGQALLELFLATGDSRYRYGAEQAFLYERQFFSATASNWPDLRHGELGDYLYSGRHEELKTRIRAGDPLPAQEPRYMSAWCHGGPGIGLTRLRAWEVLREPLYLSEARAALSATEQSLEDERMNYSLCHGRCGNAETFVEAARVLGDPALMEIPHRVAMQGWEAYESKGLPWPCGTMQAVPDPGLLLGEAGIGLYFLRLGRPETPSVTMVTAPAGLAAEPDNGAGYARALKRAVDEQFGRTIRSFMGLGMDGAELLPGRAPGTPERTDASAAYDAIRARVEAERDPARRELLDDAFRLERERWELALGVSDFTREYMATLVHTPDAEMPWSEARVELSPRARVVHSAHDWEAWLQSEDAESGPPGEDDTFHLLQASDARVSVRRLSPFAALVLQAVRTPATLDDVVSAVQEAVASDDGGPSREWLEDRVVEQLRQAYRAGFVTVETGVGAAA